MGVSVRYLRFRLAQAGLLPRGRTARLAWYLLALDLLLLALQKLLGLFRSSYAQSLGGWVTFLSFVVIVLFTLLGFRWLKSKLLWRLRNRLIVTYMFIGVIPVVLLLTITFITLYLFAGQFANFVVTSELDTRLRSLASVNDAIANELAGRLTRHEAVTAESLAGLQKRDPVWARRKVCAWQNDAPLPLCKDGQKNAPFVLASFPQLQSGAIVRDEGALFLRAATKLQVNTGSLTVVSSESLDHELLESIAANLGEVTLYAGVELQSQPAGPPANSPRTTPQRQVPESASSQTGLHPTFVSGTLPPAASLFDHEITFAAPLPVVDWTTGTQERVGGLRVQTRPSILYTRLFAALADFARGVEYSLLFVAIFFAIIELIALLVGTYLTRSITGAVADIYKATIHVNRGDLSHRIPIKSGDQLATLASSFNSMTASLERLLQEQREKERLQNELAIAQEVQAQLFPREISQISSLEVHGFCRPARTVSGDYYDFLSINSDRLILAVGDVSGKGISAALLMATIHSAVRAYSLEGIPTVREMVAVGSRAEESMLLASRLQGVEHSPGTLLSLLNHQLYISTPMEKYATMFLAVYDGVQRKLTYSNAGHLPPFALSEDGSVRRLDRGGMVIGLFADQNYEEASVQLGRGELFLAYSDGVTEPENDFGEFGEDRLLDLVRENRHLPLPRISELVTAAVDDWIGANEQPDDVTLVLARAR